MHLLFTDSGVGGLSVCAYAERFLRTHGFREPVKLTYVNASPENDFGYNSMGSRQEKVAYFDRFLAIVAEKYKPDLIYVACNTLSVLMSETRVVKNGDIPVKGIVETGATRLARDLKRAPRAVAAIFGTPTTINEGTYPEMLKKQGIIPSRIITQACPGLADTISEDRQGLEAQKEIRDFVHRALDKSDPSRTDYLAYLACTHYGYRKELFAAAFQNVGIHARILNPNEFAIDDLLESIGPNSVQGEKKAGIDVKFVSRYRIPETALETIAYFLEEISPKTIQAFTHYSFAPELF